MRILVTGANGFVGGYLIRHLLRVQPDAQITGVVHEPSAPGIEPAVRFVPGDITDRAAIRKLIRTEHPDHLYHLAGAASGAGQDRQAILRANVDGARWVMEAAAELVPPARMLFISTGYVYGNCDLEHPAQENDPVRPLGPYAESKHDAEPYAHAAGAIIARAFNHTGPEQTTAFVVPAFAAQIAAIERGTQPPELRVGNLEALRDFLDVRDVVRAYQLLMAHGEPGGIYNVCRGEAVSMQSLLDSLLALARVPITVQPDPQRMRPSDIAVSVGDPSKLRTATGWQPNILVPQTLRDTLDWWRSQTEG
jgi:GDP-4-dehydro-6-deoxy-D-mannose reductase